MDANKTITANFTQDPPTYTLTVNTSGQGTVTRSPDQASYPAGNNGKAHGNTPSGMELLGMVGRCIGIN
jgi:hypothetical protein